ncbi:MAG: hypothetical protein U0271_25325 [Polyangiaceae bacterium]
MSSWFERVGNMASAMRLRQAHSERAYWSRDRLEAWQAARLNELVAHATRSSRFYRDHYGGVVGGPIILGQLPTLTKDMMMARFDDVVTDPRLELDGLLAHLSSLRSDELYLGEHRVMSSSGSSGRKAVYVYDREAWRTGMMQANLRLSELVGLAPGWPRPRIASVAAPDGKHMTYRGSASMDIGVYRAERFSAAAPLDELSRALDRYQPDFILGYPSVLAQLAREQKAGRLDLHPRAIITSSEVRTAAMSEAIRDAWGVEPFDCLGLTETGITAVDCYEHAGMHLFEDLSIVEVVDAANKPVRDGAPGAKVLVTNLYNRVEPIIRLEVSDLMTVTSERCACGRTFKRVVALDGRSDDVLELRGPRGAVTLHPIHLRSVLGGDRAVLQYQVTQHAESLDVALVLAPTAGPDTLTRIESALSIVLRDRGADSAVRARSVPEIARESGPGKLKLVRALPRDRVT